MDGKHRYNSFNHNIIFSIARCVCGNCSVFLLQNIRECYCCTELEGCGESLETDLVQQDFPLITSLKCITDHRSFNPVCLQKWSLRMAACKFKTKEKQQYRQKGSEERLVVRVSIRVQSGQTANDRSCEKIYLCCNCSSAGCLKCVEFYNWFRLH